MSFNLEKSIKAWRKELHKLQGFEPEYIDELEDHLRSAIEDKIKGGHSEKAAFEECILEFGGGKEQLSKSFQEARSTGLAIGGQLRFYLRFLKRNAGLTFLNVSGLSIGMTVTLLIVTFVYHELHVDQFHEKKDNVYRINSTMYKNGELNFSGSASFPGVGPDAVSEFPEVVQQCRVFKKYRPGTVKYKDKIFREENLFYADSTFFDVFSYPLISGNKEEILKRPNTGIIDQKIAKKYFGDDNPVGKRITIGSYDAEEQFEITGVFKSIENSHLKFSFIFSYSSYVQLHGPVVNTQWSWMDFFTYIQLQEGIDPDLLEAKFPAFIDRHIGDRLRGTELRFGLQPLSKIYLTSDNLNEPGPVGNKDLISLLLAVAIIILLIAWVNYVNLYSAHAIKRAREVGIRKVLGSSKRLLIRQFMVESLFLNGLSVLIALAFFLLLVPWFNSLNAFQIDATLISQPTILVVIGMMWLLGGILTGIYPALVLSSFQPIPAIKGLVKYTGNGAKIRQYLTIGQFLLGILFVSATLVIYDQIQFLSKSGVGIDTNNMLIVRSPDLITENELHGQRMLSFRDQLLGMNFVSKASVASELPGKAISWWGGAQRVAASGEERVTLYRMGVDENYLPMYGAPFLAGNNFSANPADDRVILNESAMKELGLNNAKIALNSRIVLARDTLVIQGIVQDFHQESLKSSIQPAIFYHNVPHEMKFVVIDFDETVNADRIATVESLYQEAFPNSTCSWFLVDDYLKDQHQLETSFLDTFTMFSGLAMFIALLGLTGLTSFYANQKSKEVSIKKLLGSTNRSLFWGLSKDLLKYVLIANVIAVPLILWFADYWLSQFAYHVNFNWIIPVVTLLVTLGLSLLTISQQFVKVTLSNPLERLRHE